MYRFQIRQLIIIRVDADTEEQPRIASVDDLRRAELHEVGLVFLIARGNQAVNFAFEFDFLFILIMSSGALEGKSEAGLGNRTLYGAYHFARRVLPLIGMSTGELSMKRLELTYWRFWMRINESTIGATEL